MELITRRVIRKLEALDKHEVDETVNGADVAENMSASDIPQELLAEYADSSTEKHVAMVEEIRKKLKFDSLRFQELEDILEAVEVNPCKLCTYCWNGKG